MFIRLVIALVIALVIRLVCHHFSCFLSLLLSFISFLELLLILIFEIPGFLNDESSVLVFAVKAVSCDLIDTLSSSLNGPSSNNSINVNNDSNDSFKIISISIT